MKQTFVVLILIVLAVALAVTIDSSIRTRIEGWATENGMKCQQIEVQLFQLTPFYLRDKGAQTYLATMTNGRQFVFTTVFFRLKVAEKTENGYVMLP